MTTKKDEFVSMFKTEMKKDAAGFKGNAKGFAELLNKGSSELRAAFRAAVEECSKDVDAAAGLAFLFPGQGA